MQEKILQEVEGTEYAAEVIEKGLDEERITDRYMAAAYGFGVAQAMAEKIVQGHGRDGWIYCGDGKNLPEEHPTNDGERMGYISSELVQVTVYDSDTQDVFVSDDCLYNGEWSNFDSKRFKVLAWTPLPEPYRPAQKAVGEDYKQQIMDRFCKVE